LISELSLDISKRIEAVAAGSGLPMEVEEIQDLVETYLMDSPRKDVAKQYIIYRNEQSKTREIRKTDSRLLTDEFISRYKHLDSPMNQLGSFVYYRTYSRWLPEEKRREYWWETVRRSVEYNCSLVPTTRAGSGRTL
jgi:anaerobic ribonucleoside-triphosphate reductase